MRAAVSGCVRRKSASDARWAVGDVTSMALIGWSTTLLAIDCLSVVAISSALM